MPRQPAQRLVTVPRLSVGAPTDTTTCHCAPFFCCGASRHRNPLERPAIPPVAAPAVTSTCHRALSFLLPCQQARQTIIARPRFCCRASRDENFSLRSAFLLPCQLGWQPIMTGGILVAVPASMKSFHCARHLRSRASRHGNSLCRGALSLVSAPASTTPRHCASHFCIHANRHGNLLCPGALPLVAAPDGTKTCDSAPLFRCRASRHGNLLFSGPSLPFPRQPARQLVIARRLFVAVTGGTETHHGGSLFTPAPGGTTIFHDALPFRCHASLHGNLSFPGYISSVAALASPTTYGPAGVAFRRHTNRHDDLSFHSGFLSS